MVTCFFNISGTINADSSARICDGSRSKGSFYYCCGPGDTCLPNSFCYSRKSNPRDSGFYLGACTDPEYADSNCNRQCSDTNQAHVVYNETTSLWSCCVIGDCTNPSNKTFQALSPGAFLEQTMDALTAIPSSTSTSSTSATTSTSAVTSSTSANSLTSAKTLSTSATSLTSAVMSTTNANTGQVAKSSSLSTGAAAGIGAGVAIGGVAILAAIILLILHSRRSRRNRNHASNAKSKVDGYGGYGNASAGIKAELVAQPITRELAADIHQGRQELGT